MDVGTSMLLWNIFNVLPYSLRGPGTKNRRPLIPVLFIYLQFPDYNFPAHSF